MLWEILEGMVLMILHPLIGIGFYKLIGIAFGITFSILVAREICYLILAYYGFSRAILSKPFKTSINWIALVILGEEIKGKLDEIIENYKERRNDKRIIRTNRKIVDWMIGHDRAALILSFIPFVPFLPTSTILAVRLMKIKHGLFILCLSTIFRVFVCCFVIYYCLDVVDITKAWI